MSSLERVTFSYDKLERPVIHRGITNQDKNSVSEYIRTAIEFYEERKHGDEDEQLRLLREIRDMLKSGAVVRANPGQPQVGNDDDNLDDFLGLVDQLRNASL